MVVKNIESFTETMEEIASKYNQIAKTSDKENASNFFLNQTITTLETYSQTKEIASININDNLNINYNFSQNSHPQFQIERTNDCCNLYYKSLPRHSISKDPSSNTPGIWISYIEVNISLGQSHHLYDKLIQTLDNISRTHIHQIDKAIEEMIGIRNSFTNKKVRLKKQNTLQKVLKRTFK